MTMGRPRKPRLDVSASPTGSFVYFMRGRNSGLVKIGVAKDPNDRRKAIQTGSAEPIDIIFLVSGGHHEERKFHFRFRHHRERGEWFRVEGNLRDFISNQELLPLPDTEERVKSVPALKVLEGVVKGYCTTEAGSDALAAYGLDPNNIFRRGNGAETFDWCVATFRKRAGWMIFATDMRELGTNRKDISEAVGSLEKAKIRILDISHPEDDTYTALTQRAHHAIASARFTDQRRAVRIGRWGGEAKGRNAKEKRDALDQSGLVSRIVNHKELTWRIKGELLQGICSVSGARRHFYGK